MGGTSPFLELPPSAHIASNALAFAIRDGFPVSPGHTLIVPRRLVATWFDASREEQLAILDLADEVKRSLDEEHRPDGYNVGFNAGAAAGQTVMHLHVHVIPRFDGDMDNPKGGVRHVIPWNGKYGHDRPPRLATGGDDPFLHHLEPLIARAREIDILAAFVQDSGVDLLHPSLFEPQPIPARVRLLTGDYLHITQATALDTLFDWATVHPAQPLVEGAFSIEVRVFETEARVPPTSFHPKSWRLAGDGFATTFVGSSNLSRSALRGGIEWNLRVDRDRDRDAYQRVAEAFERRWAESVVLDAAWIERYRQRIVARPQALPPGEVDDEVPPKLPSPHDLQRTALAALARDRAEGVRSGLVVLATGLGKTLLAVLDTERFAAEIGRRPRVLLVAHREELLTQAARWFRCAAREAGRSIRVSWCIGGRSELDGDVVLASVQKLSLAAGITALAAERFDYAVIDEVHHAHAASYRRVLAALKTSFLLGLTATPERTDGGDVLGLFGDHVFHRADLGEGIANALLVPFRYYGLKDTVAYDAIPWRNGRFDPSTLDEAVATDARMEKLWAAWTAHPGQRSLVFCASHRHAEYVRRDLVARGVRAGTVFGDGGTLSRHDALRALTDGTVDALVTVDLFNEGVDIPAIDRVVMLRPTESTVIFLQQLGRGLRRSQGKTDLTVLDFVGNHRVFLWKVETLLSLAGGEATGLRDYLSNREPAHMPPGCSIDLDLEAKDLLANLLPAGRQTFESQYDRYVESHGVRPKAGEMLRAGFSVDAVRTRDRGWFHFVAAKGHLTGSEHLALEAYGEWLRDLETTNTTKSFKLVVLEVLLDSGAFFDGIELDVLADRCREWIQRDAMLHADVAGVKELGDLRTATAAAWRAYWRKNPVAAWTGGRWFALEGTRLVSRLRPDPAASEALASMTAELVDLRLAQYRRRHASGDSATSVVCRVTWNQRDPILQLPDALRDRGELEARLDDGRVWTFRCKAQFCNVAHPIGTTRNLLPDLLRGWFGPDAGRPGTTFQVRFRQSPDGWWIEPVGVEPTMSEDPGLITWYPTLAAAAGVGGAGVHEAPDAATVRLPMVASNELFAIRAAGGSMDGGRAPIRDGDWCVLRWMRGAPVEAMRDRVVLVQSTTRDVGMRFQLKRLVERDGRWWFVSAASGGPEFPADEHSVVLARVERVFRPESLGPAPGARLTEEEIVRAMGGEGSRAPRIQGHRMLWVEAPGQLRAPDRIDDATARLPGETAFVFTRIAPGEPWCSRGVARWREAEGCWAFEAVDHATWKALGQGRSASRTLPDEVTGRVDAWVDALMREPGAGTVVTVEGKRLRIVGRSAGGGLRIDGGDGGFAERTVSRTDLAWVLLAAEDAAANGGVLDEARVNRLRYLEGTPKSATRWIDTGWALGLWRLGSSATHADKA
ncbi:MAG: DEAD/DEAH box helicase family protein [Deltaproteobacteria bacterium]|nr:DEAD/DEAH box helicase family protein [Deltaproteobacteria bacterium]